MSVTFATERPPDDRSVSCRPEVVLTDDTPVVTASLSTSTLPFLLALEERYKVDEKTGEVHRIGDKPGADFSPIMSANWIFWTLDSVATIQPVTDTEWHFDDPP
jgi:hypothetical protein